MFIRPSLQNMVLSTSQIKHSIPKEKICSPFMIVSVLVLSGIIELNFNANFARKKVIGYPNIKIHIRRIHTKKCINNYTVLTKNKYSCKICEREISLSYTAIWKHVDIVHGMNFREYEEQYEPMTRKLNYTKRKDLPSLRKSECETNRKKYSCKICDNTSNHKVNDLGEHLETYHNTTRHCIKKYMEN